MSVIRGNSSSFVRTTIRSSGHALLAVVALAACSAARAETVRCVTSVTALKKAVADAQAAPEGDAWVINVHAGGYQLDADLLFQPGTNNNYGDNKDFVMTGGWTDANCADEANRIVDPAATVISGVNSTAQKAGTQLLFTGDNRSYQFESIRFSNFGTFKVDDGACGAFQICPDTYSIDVERVEFDHGENVYFSVNDAEKFIFRNNLVQHIKPITFSENAVDFAPVGFTIRNKEDPPQISFNTFADLTCSTTAGGVTIASLNPSIALHHNIIQATCQYGLYIQPTIGSETQAGQTPYYNLYSSVGGSALGNLAGNGNAISADPQFHDPSIGNYRLENTSPAVNSGATPVGAILGGFVVSVIDLDGNYRPVGTRYDIGAYESIVNNGAPPVITVNSKNDVDDGVCDATHCSLREAINKANSQIGTQQTIAFDISGSCPQPIVLNSPLPDIKDTVTIDGYTQPGSVENGKTYGSDAVVCIIIGPGANISHVFAVPTGEPDTTTLTVKGIGFGNSFYAITTAAIELRAGSGHYIQGNVFGGYMPTSGAFVGGLSRGVFLGGTARNTTIGGVADADRNYFGDLSQNAIVINLGYNDVGSGHIIRNNYIGVRPDGLNAQPNAADGISSSSGAQVLIDKNTIAANVWGISLLGSSTKGFTITRNNIGVNALGIANATLPNDVGIFVGTGSGGHVIGATALENLQPGTYSNFIDNNNGDGIQLDSAAGDFNSIRGNVIGNNGKGGNGIGIDLGATQAQLANDSGDGDAGPNAKQNFPIIKGSAPVGAARQVNAILSTAANTSVRIDFYQAPVCNGPRGADATNLVGSYDVNSGASGVVSISQTVAEAGKSGYLTATATTSSGRTSELSPCVAEDIIFRDGIEKPGL